MFGLFRQESDLVVAAPAAPWGSSVAVEERYRPLVERLEQSARISPASYRLRVMLGGVLGYSVVIALGLLLTSMTAAIGWFVIVGGGANFLTLKLLLIVSVIAWAILRSLWVQTEPPQGRRIESAEAPALFELIAKLRSRIGGPRIHEVLISQDLNAAIVQRPRLGIFGLYRNSLVIGLPLLQGLTEDEAAAVIAHELGHFAGQHGRVASFIYRVRMTWAQLAEHFQEGHSANLLRRFFAWYGPWFNAYSFVLARSHEYAADRAAADATSAVTAASALVRITTQGDRIDRHWAGLWEEAALAPQPSRFPYSSFADGLPSETLPEDGERSLDSAMAMRTSLDDTHPCLAERLKALGVAPALPPAIERSAAQALLGAASETLAAEFDEAWWAEASGWWSDANRERRNQAAELAALEEASRTRELGRDELLRQAELTALIRGDAAALVLYDSLLAADPEDDEAAYFAGVTRLSLDDATGIAILEDLAARRPVHALATDEAIFAYHLRRGEVDAAAAVRQRLEGGYAVAEQEDTESRALGPSTVLAPPPLDEEQLAELRRRLDGLFGLRAAYLGSRTLSQGSTQLVLLVEPKLTANARDVLEEVGAAVLPYGPYIGFALAGDTRWLRDRLATLPGARISP